MITITFATDNAAFEDDREAEIARVLRVLAARFATYTPDAGNRPIYDSNGNRIGEIRDEETPEVTP